MSESHQDQKRSRWGWRHYLVLAFFVFVIYPLSIGPVYWLLVNADPGGKTLLHDAHVCLYFPLNVGFNTLGMPNWFEEYIIWWANL